MTERLLPEIDVASLLPALDSFRLIEGMLPTVDAAALLPAFDNFRLVEQMLPKIDTAAMLPALDSFRLIEGMLPKIDAAALLPAFDNFRLVEQMLPKIDTAAMLPALDSFRLIEGMLPKIDSAALMRGVLPFFTDDFLVKIRGKVERLIPRNLRDLEEFRYEDMTVVMREEGLPFALVPDAATARALLDAEDGKARKQVLVRRSEPIFESCEAILDLCASQSVAFCGARVREAVAAYRSGFAGAAQSLATNVIDSVMKDEPDLTHRDFIVGRRSLSGGVTGVEYFESHAMVRVTLTLLPLVRVHAKDNRGQNEPLGTFSRNSTAHRVTPQQYTRANAVHSIMLATSLLGFVQDLW